MPERINLDNLIKREKIYMKKISLIVLLCVGILLSGVLSGCMKGTDIDKNNGYVVLEENFGAEEYGIGFRASDIAFGLEVQKYLDEMINDDKASEISNKWFGKDSMIKDAPFKEESTAPEGDDSLQKIKDKGFFTVGLDASFPPMGFTESNGEIVGFDIDLAREVAKRMGVELKTQPIEWDAKEMELSSGKIDCIWNGMTIDEARLKEMYFTKAYINNRQIIIVPEGSAIKTKADLEGKTIGLQKGSSALKAVDKDPVKSKIGKIEVYENNQLAFADLKIGRIDALVVDEVVGRYLVEKA